MKKVDRKRLFNLHNKKDLRQFVLNIQAPHKVYKRKIMSLCKNRNIKNYLIKR